MGRCSAGNGSGSVSALPRVAHVHERETRGGRFRQRAELQFQILLRLGGRDRSAGALMRHAIRRAPRAQALRAQGDEVEDQHFVGCQPRQAQQHLQRFERLQAAEHAGHGAEHAGLGAVADEAVARGFGPHAAQAGRAGVAAHQLQLAFVLIDAGEQHRLAGAQRHVVEQELGAEVVAAVEDQVVAAATSRSALPASSRSACASTRTSGLSARTRPAASAAFSLAAVGQRIPGLAMQVRGLEPVAIDDAESADAGAREVLQHRHAESAGADHQHRGRAQSCLARRRPLPAARSGASSQGAGSVRAALVMLRGA